MQMNHNHLRDVLANLRDGHIDLDEAMQRLNPPFVDIGYARVDLHRQKRQGHAEVVYCPGKTPQQIAGILQTMDAAGQNLLASRAEAHVFAHVEPLIDGIQYNVIARLIWKINTPPPTKTGVVQVVSAGTSDMPVAEEAAAVAEFMGSTVRRTYDAGVAGLHRLLDSLDEIRQARVLVVVAGMEGALPSVVGGLVAAPVIAVPTSIGYGANFGGLSALLGMLNSCSSNVAVVNIDNGFGAGMLANLINDR